MQGFRVAQVLHKGLRRAVAGVALAAVALLERQNIALEAPNIAVVIRVLQVRLLLLS